MSDSNFVKVFNRALELQRPIFSSGKKWKVASRWRGIFFSQASLFQNHLHHFHKLLDSLETCPVKFGSVSIEERKKWIEILDTGTRLLEKTSCEKDRLPLSLKLIGLKYRIGSENGGLNPSISRYENFRLLSRLGAQWKKAQDHFDEKELTLSDIDRLNASSVYSEYVKEVVKTKEALDRFFCWTIRDHMDPEILIEFPARTQEIVSSSLQQKFGKINRRGIRVEFVDKKQWQEKHLVMLFEGEEKSILDPQTAITFRGDYTLTLEQIFDVFKNKYRDVGKLEVLADGILNWSGLELGWWNRREQRFERVDVHQEEWWREMPRLESLSRQEASKRYQVNAEGEHWIVSSHVTRGILNLSYEETHAFLEIGIPNEKGGYDIYNFGKYGIEFPSNALDILRLFAKTMPGKIAYPDDNCFCSHRQHGYFARLLSPHQGYDMMRLIKKDVLKGREGDLVYQIESDNCAKWTIEILTGISGNTPLPNLYRMSLLDTEPISAVRHLFVWIKKLPKSVQGFILTRLHYPLAPWRGKYIVENGKKVWKSLNSHEFWQSAEVYLPALMVKKQKENLFDYDSVEIEGKSTWKKLLELAVKPIEFLNEFIERIEEGLKKALLEVSNPIIAQDEHPTRSVALSCFRQ